VSVGLKPFLSGKAARPWRSIFSGIWTPRPGGPDRGIEVVINCVGIIGQAQAGQPARRAERLEAGPDLGLSVESYGLLAAVGVIAALAPFALMAASTLDPLLGVGLLFRRWRGWAGIRRKLGSAVGTG